MKKTVFVLFTQLFLIVFILVSGKPTNCQILPISPETEFEKQASQAPSNEIIGRWKFDWLIKADITISRKDGKLLFVEKFDDGSILRKELIEKSTQRGLRFDYTTGSSTGDHYVINKSGDLEVRDNQGLITVAKKIK